MSMKRIFPIITILITLSLLGLILFQYLWLQSAIDIKKEQISDKINRATTEAAITLMEDHSLFPTPKKKNPLFPSDIIPFEFQKPSIIQRYSKQDINDIIKNAFKKEGLEKSSFEFAVAEMTLNGDQIQTDDFFKYYLDSSNNTRRAIPLQAASGSALENLSKDETLVIIVPGEKALALQGMGLFILGAILFTIIIITAFFLTIRTLLKQKKLSEIKSDFINNMTHEFKTPLATISLAVDALKNEKVIADRTKSTYFTGIIKEENIRMNKQVETILQAALLDKQKVELALKPMHAHDLIGSAVNNIELPLKEKGGELKVSLNADVDLIDADEVHFTNLINNLLDNALKYSEDNPRISLTTSNQSGSLRVKIEDNGIGMTKDTLNRIFEKFYRAHTGNVHNVKGFGLGLSYVKKMVVAHHGTIKADSTLGKGSTFIISVPLSKKK